MEFVRVGTVDDFRDGRGRVVKVAGQKVAVFRRGDRLTAMQDACPHMGASLADGRLECGRVICHWHGWTFDLETGHGDQKSRTWLRARTYPVRVDDGEVFVGHDPAWQQPRPRAGADQESWVAWDDSFLNGSDGAPDREPGAGERDHQPDDEQRGPEDER